MEKKEGRILIFRSAIAGTSHLKIKDKLELTQPNLQICGALKQGLLYKRTEHSADFFLLNDHWERKKGPSNYTLYNLKKFTSMRSETLF